MGTSVSWMTTGNSEYSEDCSRPVLAGKAQKDGARIP